LKQVYIVCSFIEGSLWSNY